MWRRNENFKYIYDFGDNWVHHIEFEELLTPKSRVKYPIWTQGENGPIEEDFGGVRKYNQVKRNHKQNTRELPVPEFFRGFSKKQINEFLIERRKTLSS